MITVLMRTKFGYTYVEQREVDSVCTEDATSDYYSCSEVDVIDSYFHWKGQDLVV